MSLDISQELLKLRWKDEMIVVLFSQKISTIFDYYLSCCFRKQDILVRCYSSENAVAIKLCFWKIEFYTYMYKVGIKTKQERILIQNLEMEWLQNGYRMGLYCHIPSLHGR